MQLTDSEFERMKKKYFPRVPWTDEGPVRRMYLARSAGQSDILSVLEELAVREGFADSRQRSVCGDAERCLEAFREKAGEGTVGLILGEETAAHWCDIAVDIPGEDGWQKLIVRSEEGENLTALAHNEGVLRFRRMES